MPLTVVSSVTLDKGEWTKLWTTTADAQNGVVHCPLLPNLKPVPVIWVCGGYEDVLNTNTFVCFGQEVMGASAQYWYRDKANQDIWAYYELNGQLGNPIPISVWLYT